MERRNEPPRWPRPTEHHPGVSTLYLDHPFMAKPPSHQPGEQRQTLPDTQRQGRAFTPELDRKLATAGHRALPSFYTHPEVTGSHPALEYSQDLVPNPVNPGALTPAVKIGILADQSARRDFPLMGIVGRASVVHFSGVTQWTYVGKQMNGVRLVQMHPTVAAAAGIRNGEAILVESPRGSIAASALVWDGIREDTIFVPNSFGPMQTMGDEFGLPRYEPAHALTDDRHFHNLSGQPAYTCFARRVRTAV